MFKYRNINWKVTSKTCQIYPVDLFANVVILLQRNKKLLSQKPTKVQVWAGAQSLWVKGLKVLVICRRRVEDGPPLRSPSVQRSWWSGVSGERLCDVKRLLWRGWPAVLSPSTKSLSQDRPLCCPVMQSPFVKDRPLSHLNEQASYSTVNGVGLFKTYFHPGSIFHVVLGVDQHF